MVFASLPRPLLKISLTILVLSMLICYAASVRCYTSINGLIKLGEGTSCDEKHVSCHEYYHLAKGSNSLVYHAGCGSYEKDPDEKLPPDLIETKQKECFSNGCNRELLTELEAAGRRVCYSAYRQPSYKEAAVICAKDVGQCYIDQMTGATAPAFYAGCGQCPAYTLYCYFCNENYCIATQETSKLIVYTDDTDI